jgi:hypothetical protein
MPKKDEVEPDYDDLPATVERSDDKAQRTFAKARASAYESRPDDGQYANRVAYSALKHTHEKVGDSWEPKEEYGPSDSQAEESGEPAREGRRETAGGVDANASKKHLQEVARRLDVEGRSKMDKDELVKAIDRANRRANERARREG